MYNGLVEKTGFEPVTYCVKCNCPTNWAIFLYAHISLSGNWFIKSEIRSRECSVWRLSPLAVEYAVTTQSLLIFLFGARSDSCTSQCKAHCGVLRGIRTLVRLIYKSSAEPYPRSVSTNKSSGHKN